MHYVDRRRAVYNIGVEVKSRGWMVHGLHHGESDLMSDYYVPPSWDGVAEKDNLILCVDVGRADAEKYSSKLQAEVLPTPKGKTWHLQTRDGYVIAVGTGLEPCSRYGEEGKKAVARLVDRIMEKVARPPGGRVPGFQKDGNWSWLKFAEKPNPEVIKALKAAGWRWSHRRQAWYHPGGAEPPDCLTGRLNSSIIKQEKGE